MKKFVSLILALVMVCALSVSAGAAAGVDTIFNNTGADSEGNPPWTSAGDVTITVNDSDSTTATVYYVVVDWGTMEFTYNTSTADQWDPENHEYKNANRQVGWVDNPNATIKVSNHSNAAITVDAGFTDDNDNKYVSAVNSGVTASICNTAGTDVMEAAQTIIKADTVGKESFDDSLEPDERFAAAPSYTYLVKVDGTPTANSATFNITVSITA